MQPSTNASGSYRSGGTGTGNIPDLSAYSDEPRYDHDKLVQLVGVRDMHIWKWQRLYGIPFPPRNSDRGGPRRYSERDVVATIWLRERIMNSNDVVADVARFFAAQPPSILPSPQPGFTTGPISLGPFGQPLTAPPLPNSNIPRVRGANTTRPLSQHTGELRDGSGALRVPEPEVWVSPDSGHLTQVPPAPDLQRGRPTGSFAGASGSWQIQPGAASGTLGSSVAGQRQYASYAHTSASDIRTLMPQLLRAFARLETADANRVINEAQETRSFESVCLQLLLPAVARVHELWAGAHMSAPEELFAQNYIRGVLEAKFCDSRSRENAPAVFVACAPREVNEIGVLALSVFWRRAGLRVIYFGQGISGDELVDEAMHRRPAAVALWLTSTQRIRAVARIAKRISQMDNPQPLFTYAGPIFVRNPDLQRKISGSYLGDDAETATRRLTAHLGIERAFYVGE